MWSHTTSSGRPSLPSSLLSLSALSTLLLTFPSPSAAFHCKEILAGKTPFDISPLGGPRVLQWSEEPDLEHQVQSTYNLTLDICNNLPRAKEKDTPQCQHGTRICAIREDDYLDGSSNHTVHPIEIAGTYTSHSGRDRSIDAKFELLSDSKSNNDVGREGFRAELHGGRYPFEDSKKGIDQRAIIEFVCDQERTGTDGQDKTGGGDNKDGDKDDDKKDGDKKDDDKKDEDGEKEDDKLRKREGSQCEDSDKDLRFCGYKLDTLKDDKKVKTLRLEWRTKYACEGASYDDEGSHWGFFTWFIIILFLATAAYLIFGSWLNYNRYGARGWDLLPHGDTIRDIPYILKDWARSVKETLQGSGSRGGYSAV